MASSTSFRRFPLSTCFAHGSPGDIFLFGPLCGILNTKTTSHRSGPVNGSIGFRGSMKFLCDFSAFIACLLGMTLANLFRVTCGLLPFVIGLPGMTMLQLSIDQLYQCSRCS